MMMSCTVQSLVLVPWFLVVVGLAGGEVSSETAMFPAMFVFGDSLVDNGNNNHLNSLARSNYLPYGIDFAGNQPTGRFSNGKTIVDFMGELLGLPEIPAFMDTVDGGVDILQGVNYASAAGGILEETGRHLNHNRGNESLGRDSEIVLKIEDHQSYKDVCVTQEFYADNNRDGCRDKERLRVYGIFEKEAHMRVWRRPTKSDEDLLVVFLWNLQPLEKTVMHRCCRVVVKTCVACGMISGLGPGDVATTMSVVEISVGFSGYIVENAVAMTGVTSGSSVACQEEWPWEICCY
ncbi:unnamed protein product [Arabidopsis lyrata]|nr:unnamed protein product [Arabidopsis lyrata]